MPTWLGWLHIIFMLEALSQSALTVRSLLWLSHSTLPLLNVATDTHDRHPAEPRFTLLSYTGCLLGFTLVGGPDLDLYVDIFLLMMTYS